MSSWTEIGDVEKDGIVVDFYLQPYMVDVDRTQALVSCLDAESRTGFAIVLNGSKLEFLIGTRAAVEVVRSQFPVNRWRWIHVHIRLIDTTLTTNLRQLNRLAETSPQPEHSVHGLSAPLAWSSSSLLFGASMFKTADKPSFAPSCFFNGRLDSPTFTTAGSVPHLLAKYDFSKEISSESIVDISGNARHGTLINLPTRAVKGYDWDGSQPDWTRATYGYGAIHFHEDDLDDAKWLTNFSITIPSTACSGAYAVEIKGHSGKRDMVTFFVRPNLKSTAQVALVLSTFTYLAYANERMFDQTRSSAMTTPDGVSIGKGNEYFENLDRRPDLGLSAYDVHIDGSPVLTPALGDQY